MSRPNVFPENPAPKPEVNLPKVQTDEEYEKNKYSVAEEIYSHSSEVHGTAIEQMMKRTQEQINERNLKLAQNKADIDKYQQQVSQIETTKAPEPKQFTNKIFSQPTQQIITPTQPLKVETKRVDDYIDKISQPHFNAPFDVLPLPSGGKLYPNCKSSVKVAYMTAADESILTSPNLLASGQFLEILINRKLLEPNLRYHDLHIGDRNAIMLWLRASSYGELYPVTLLDENDVPFETEINLNDLKMKKLEVAPDNEGLFTYQLPMSKKTIKFKFLNLRDTEEVEIMSEEDRDNHLPINQTALYTLQRQIIEVDGNRSSEVINDFIEFCRIGDIDALREYITSIESGIDLELTVGTPGGGSIKTFLPLNLKFFWPKLSI